MVAINIGMGSVPPFQHGLFGEGVSEATNLSCLSSGLGRSYAEPMSPRWVLSMSTAAGSLLTLALLLPPAPSS